MPDYDFHTLSPVDFEELTRDLLQASEKIVLQSFKVGRDFGVDLRFATDGENRVVQCKHYRKSGYAALRRDVRAEVPKIRRMNPPPTRYFLSTSVELSDANKKELAGILGLSTTQDILGSNDLNNLLGLNPDVERRHYKLWLASSAVLQRVLHNAEAMQTDFEFRRIGREVPRFVQTRAYTQATKQLARDRVLVLSGLPGVGKSTIADFLIYEKFAEGFQPVIARNGFDEARTLYRAGVPQVFLYDDFLGATFLGEGGSAFARNEDRAITDFLNVIADDQSKLLILTTREHIFSEALEMSERLRHSSISDFRYLVRVGSYTAEQRARILYNHAYFNGLRLNYLDRLLDADFFLEIIGHPKFSPRIVEWLTTPRRVKACRPEDYPHFARRLLDDPSEIWRHAYEEQISHSARSVLLTLHSFNGRVSHNRLTEAFDALHAARATRYGFTTAPGDFFRALRVLSGSFITISHGAVQFVDPSVQDLMNSILHDVPDNCLDILRGAVSMTQVSTIWDLAEMRDGEHISAQIAKALPSLAEGFRRALDADLFSYGDGYVAAYAPQIEARLELLLEIACSQDNRALDSLVPSTVERTLQVWRGDKPNISAAIRASHLLGQLTRLQEHQTLRQRLLSGLAAQTMVDLEPDEMVHLLVARKEAWATEDRNALRAMAERWPLDMGDRLRACRSMYELRRLGENLRAVSVALAVDLRSPIQAVDVEQRLFDPDEESAVPIQEPHEVESDVSFAERRAIRDLFATLQFLRPDD